MPKTSKPRHVTRQNSKLQYKGGPWELAKTVPSTCRQLLQVLLSYQKFKASKLYLKYYLID